MTTTHPSRTASPAAHRSGDLTERVCIAFAKVGGRDEPSSTSNVTDVDQLLNAAFSVPRDPRSAEYKAGARAALDFRINGARIKSPYAASTAQDDAYHAGIAEGHAIWRKAMAKIADGSAS